MLNRLTVAVLGALLPVTQTVADDGAKLYTLHCAACHGRDATGNGPMSPALTLPPPDLTDLAVRNAHVFPTADVIAHIDGRIEVTAHGGPMPVYGWLLDGPQASVPLPDGSSVTTSDAIAQIVAWLMAQQVN